MQEIINNEVPYKPPNGFVCKYPGPTNQIGASFEISTKPLLRRNHIPTRPPCSPAQPHKELSSLILISDSKIPSKNNPKRILIICLKGILKPI